MSSGTPYIGSKISLVSKAEIRYEGFLYTIDQNDSTVTLAKVISLGTEDRVPGAGAVPAREEVFEYIVFRGADIKDLHVCEGPKKVEDPAIVTHSYSSQSYNPNYHRGPPPFPPQGGGPGMNFGYNPFNMPPPNNNNAPVDHHNAQHNNRQQSPSPRHDQQQQQQRGGGGGGGKSGGFQDNRKPKESGKYRDDGYARENRDNTGNKQGKEKDSSRRDHEGHDNRDNRDDNRAPRHNRDNNNRDNSNRDNNRDNRSRGRRDEEGDDNDSKTRDNRYRDNRREYRDNNNRDNNRDNNNRDNNNRDNRRDNRDSYHQRGERDGGRGEGRTKHEDRDDQRSATGSESGRGQARGGVRGGPRGANRGPGRGGRGAPRGGGGGGGGEGAATTTTATRNKFTEDFDFQTSNAKFNKEEIEKELLKVLKKVKIKDEDGTEEIKDMEERESDERAPLPSPDKFYDRSKSFFDNILCEAMPPRNEEEVMTRRQEQALNTETFGSSATHYRPPYRGRGRGRGRWRGGRGFHRGRGNFRGNQGNNNRRWVDYEFDYEAAGIKNKSQPKATTED